MVATAVVPCSCGTKEEEVVVDQEVGDPTAALVDDSRDQVRNED